MKLILILATLVSMFARAEVQTVTCNTGEDKFLFKLIDGRPSSRHKKNVIKYTGAMVTVTGSTREVDEVNDALYHDAITFQRTFLGFSGKFSASYEGCYSDCVNRTVSCTSVVR